MRILVTALIQSIPDFLNVAVFLLFIFIIFAILGVFEYNGILYNRCRLTPDPVGQDLWPINDNITRVCTIDGSGMFSCPAGNYCGNPDRLSSLANEGISDDDQIDYGILNFDNLATSLLTVFSMVTTVGWTPIMLNLMDCD